MYSTSQPRSPGTAFGQPLHPPGPAASQWPCALWDATTKHADAMAASGADTTVPAAQPGSGQQHGSQQTHVRQLSMQDSVQLMAQPSASLSQQAFMQTTSLDASWSAAGLPNKNDCGGHCRKGSQESVDMPVSLASGSWHSSITGAGSLTVPRCGSPTDDAAEDPSASAESLQQRFSKTLSDVLKRSSSGESEAMQVDDPAPEEDKSAATHVPEFVPMPAIVPASEDAEALAKEVKQGRRPPAGRRGAAGRRDARSTSSVFRGVTKHRRTHRWEAHIWTQKKQVYLGGFEREGQAGRAHDVMALKCRGEDGPLNRPASEYDALRPLMDEMSTEEVVALLRQESKGSPVKVPLHKPRRRVRPAYGAEGMMDDGAAAMAPTFPPMAITSQQLRDSLVLGAASLPVQAPLAGTFHNPPLHLAEPLLLQTTRQDQAAVQQQLQDLQQGAALPTLRVQLSTQPHRVPTPAQPLPSRQQPFPVQPPPPISQPPVESGAPCLLHSEPATVPAQNPEPLPNVDEAARLMSPEPLLLPFDLSAPNPGAAALMLPPAAGHDSLGGLTGSASVADLLSFLATLDHEPEDALWPGSAGSMAAAQPTPFTPPAPPPQPPGQHTSSAAPFLRPCSPATCALGTANNAAVPALPYTPGPDARSAGDAQMPIAAGVPTADAGYGHHAAFPAATAAMPSAPALPADETFTLFPLLPQPQVDWRGSSAF